MAEPDVLIVDEHGQASVAGSALAERLRKRRGRYALAVDAAGLLLFKPEGVEAPRVQMAGEILTRMTVMEVINVIAQAGWRGDLHVIGEGTHILRLDQGVLKAAISDAEETRLGEVLYRSGVISREALEEIIESVGEEHFGEIAVRRGLLDAQALYAQLQRQAEAIFFASLLEAEGTYVFVQPLDDLEHGGTTIHVPVQGLLMEGVQRIDEMALFRERVPSPSFCPEPAPEAAAPKNLEDGARNVLALCDGERSIDELARITGLGEFAATRAVYQLVQAKMVVLKAPRAVDPRKVEELVARFNEVLQDIFMAVATYGGLGQTRATLHAWIQGSGYAPYFGEGVDDLGMIDAAHVGRAMQGVDSERPMEALHQALHELAAFALFSATTTLPRDQELTLARDVNVRLKAIRLE
ncbi:MAG: DUF4388 domain-containing protein [Myxococcota bacterium]